MASLEEHLLAYGIKYFADNSYWEWGGEKLGTGLGKRINRYMKRFAQRVASQKERADFYELIARPEIAPVVHSLRADTIRASGEFVAEHIIGRKSVLDVGCGLGYLTSWYARSDPQRIACGVDSSSRTVEQAERHAKRLGITNCTFVAADITTWVSTAPFDAIVDTQALQYLPSLAQALSSLRRQIADDGILISLPAIGTPAEAQPFVDSLVGAGFFIERLGWIYHADLGEDHVSPAFVASSHGPGVTLDMKKEYEELDEVEGEHGQVEPGSTSLSPDPISGPRKPWSPEET